MTTPFNQWPVITDPQGRELLGRFGDLHARFMLIDACEDVYLGPGLTAEHAACTTLIHAEHYLRDRIGYEMEPWPKGMIQAVTE